MIPNCKAAYQPASQALFKHADRPAFGTQATPSLTCKEFNHIPGLGSILRLSPAPPAQKLKATLILVGNLTMGDLLSRLSCAHLSYLSRVVNHDGHSNILRKEIVQIISSLATTSLGDTAGVAVTDIWSPESHTPTVEQS